MRTAFRMAFSPPLLLLPPRLALTIVEGSFSDRYIVPCMMQILFPPLLDLGHKSPEDGCHHELREHNRLEYLHTSLPRNQTCQRREDSSACLSNHKYEAW